MSLIFLFCGLTHNHLGAYPPSHGGISTVCKLTRNVSVYGGHARMLGLTVPTTLLASADEVIE